MTMCQRSDTLIVIPVFNEEKAIGKVIDDIRQGHFKFDIVVINDGSFDKTAEILKNKNIFVLTHIFNMGIGASFQTGCKFALAYGYKYIIRMDGDRQHNPRFIDDILMPVKKDEADIVIGSRFLGKSEFKSSFFRIIGISIISVFLNMITKKNITDPTSGFCAMNRKAFKFFSENCAEDYPEPEIVLQDRDFRTKEIPVEITRRNEGASSITPFMSIYYMAKVLLVLFINIFKREAK